MQLSRTVSFLFVFAVCGAVALVAPTTEKRQATDILTIIGNAQSQVSAIMPPSSVSVASEHVSPPS